ncbi:hypothetical protein F5146DRAFT_1145370 [Armillaria mellea]|nr:hypothetical protein F5146DRAFT_1145370 [Armillaria mellea]
MHHSHGHEVSRSILPAKRYVEITPQAKEHSNRCCRRVYSDNSDNGHGTQSSAVEPVQPAAMDELNTLSPSPTDNSSDSEQYHSPPSTPSPGHTQASPAPIADSRHPNHGYDAPTISINSEIDEVRIAAQFIDELKSAMLEESNMQPDHISCLTFFATTNASEETYKSFLFAYKERHPSLQHYSFYQMKKHVEHLSGVIPISHDMCVDSCAAFMGPFKDLEEFGPIIQALYSSPASTKNMQHHTEVT